MASTPLGAGLLRAGLLALITTVGLASPAAAATHGVEVSDDKFTPSSLTITKGDSVTWTWADGGHNVHIQGGPDSGYKNSGATFSHTFGTAGTFSYVCDAHDEMRGSVTVNEPAPAPQPQPQPQPAPPPAAEAASTSAPPADTVGPTISALRVFGARKAPRLRMRLSEQSTVIVTLRRRARRVQVRTANVDRVVRRRVGPGTVRVALGVRGRRPGLYTVRVVAIDAAGNQSAARRLTIRVR